MMTLSCYIYQNNLTNDAITVYVYFDTPSASDNFATVTTRNGGGAGEELGEVPCATWTKLTWSGDISAYTDLEYGLQVRIWLPSGSLDATSKYVCLSELKFEQGGVATPYPVEDLSYVKDRCDDYWQQSYDEGTAVGTATTLGALTFYIDRANTSQCGYMVFLKRRMRTTPTMTIYSPSTGASGHCRDVTTAADLNSSLPYARENSNSLMFSIDEGGAALGNQIQFHYVADAEL